MDNYAAGYEDGLIFGERNPDAIDGKIALALADDATSYDLGFIAGLSAAKVRAGEDG